MSIALSSLSRSLIPHTRKIIASAHAHILAIMKMLLPGIAIRGARGMPLPVPVLVPSALIGIHVLLGAHLISVPIVGPDISRLLTPNRRRGSATTVARLVI